MERVTGFRGKVTGAKVKGSRIAVIIEVNPKWDLPEKQKDSAVREWILARTSKFFRVQFIK